MALFSSAETNQAFKDLSQIVLDRAENVAGFGYPSSLMIDEEVSYNIIFCTPNSQCGIIGDNNIFSIRAQYSTNPVGEHKITYKASKVLQDMYLYTPNAEIEKSRTDEAEARIVVAGDGSEEKIIYLEGEESERLSRAVAKAVFWEISNRIP